MIATHVSGDHTPSAQVEAIAWTPVLAAAVLAVGYAWLAACERRRRGWPVVRTALFVSGAALLALALSPGVDGLADRDFGGHAAQHLLLAMLAPLGLVLGAPVTLLLRQLPHRHARRLGRLLHTRAVAVLAHPTVGLVLTSGGLVLLCCTGLYELSTRNEAVHAAVHAHLLASGALWCWAIAGPDPAPHRASVRVRLVALGVSILVHAIVAQLVFAGLLVQVDVPVEQRRAAGNLMYLGGDVAELLLALALLVTWRPSRAPRRTSTHQVVESPV